MYTASLIRLLIPLFLFRIEHIISANLRGMYQEHKSMIGRLAV